MARYRKGGVVQEGPKMYRMLKLFMCCYGLDSVGQGAVCGIPVIRYGSKLGNKSNGGVDYRAGIGGQLLSASLPSALIRTIHI
jgi:hypothetical protein